MVGGGGAYIKRKEYYTNPYTLKANRRTAKELFEFTNIVKQI